MKNKKGSVYGYRPELARSGADAPLPPIETWPNQHRGYEIKRSEERRVGKECRL